MKKIDLYKFSTYDVTANAKIILDEIDKICMTRNDCTSGVPALTDEKAMQRIIAILELFKAEKTDKKEEEK